jgi:hypothetical protein
VLVSKSSWRWNEQVLGGATKMVNFIKQRAVHSRMFKKLCENLDKEHINLLLHTEVWWLSRGSVLNRVSELKSELMDYTQENSVSDFADCYEGEEWMQKLAYLSDSFHHVNKLNKPQQGPGENVLMSSDKIFVQKRKLNL